MARTASKGVAPVELQPLDETALLTTQNLVATLGHEQDATVRAVAAQLGYQLPADCTDPDLIQRDIAANMRRSVEACLEVGRGLQVLKAACGHGQFLPRLEVLGIEHSVAKRFMQTAAKFSSLGTNAALTKALGSQSKLFEMLVLDDEQIEELELTGQTGELTLDDVATMSVKELRQALREARKDVEANGQVLAAKNAKIDELATQLARKPLVTVPAPDEKARELRQEVTAIAFETEADITGKLREAFNTMDVHAQETGTDHRSFQAQLVAHLERLLRQLREEFQLPELAGDEDFSWMTADEA